MSLVRQLLTSAELAQPLPAAEARALAAELGRIVDLSVYPGSISGRGCVLFFLGRRDTDKFLGVIHAGAALAGEFIGESRSVTLDGKNLLLTLCPTDHTNAMALRRALPFTAPVTLGLRKSVGCGDRLGLATPGHVRAVRKGSMAPIFAQQSIREMTRTQRSPEQVMDDATWGVFQEGWREGFGADADHLKTLEDVDRCVAAGFVFYTVDPGDHVDNAADDDDPATLRRKVEALPWSDLEASPADLRRRYLGRDFDVGDFAVSFSEEELLRGAAKYGRAVAHTVRMYRHLVGRMGDRSPSPGSGEAFELEMSVDETETPTSIAEHFFIASELKRLGVKWVSLAPRYVGRFEKGVDYIGDLAAFETDFARHVAVARALGPYKLSLHSGSDKFSIYPIFGRLAGDLVHLKTAGTSYLEALRAIAGTDPDLFREILAFAFERYEEDRASYHVSADPARVARPDQLADDELVTVLDDFDGREMLHVTFGSVLTSREPDGSYRFRDRLLGALKANEEAHYADLEAHFDRHIAPFG
ncbi:MAG: D-tagaturonate epimerase UxaE [Anaerolineae bacterium]